MSEIPDSKRGPRGFVSAQDVARLAGVSRSAVSRCFTPGASIAPETRKRVMEAARALGYQVNDLARGLLARQSRLVGLVVSHPEVGFRAHLTAALSRLLIGRGSIPVLIEAGRSLPENNAARSILFGHRAEATIVLSGSPAAEFVELARLNGQPLIVIGRDEAHCDAVHIGNAPAAIEAARHFAATGARRLGVIGSASATPSVVEREQAFMTEAGCLGLPVRWERGADSTHAGGAGAAARMFAGAERPDALFCVNDLMAFGALDMARSMGISVPDALQVIGFDDLPEAAWPAYALSSFRQDATLVAEAAISLIDRRQASPDAAEATLDLVAPPVWRKTTRPAGGG